MPKVPVERMIGGGKRIEGLRARQRRRPYSIFMSDLLPPIPLEEWRPTKETLHRFAQIVGKVALAKGIRRNHWWHLTFRITPRGWTTLPLGAVDEEPIFLCSFDFFDHELQIVTDDGRTAAVSLPGRSVAEFYEAVLGALDDLGVDVTLAHPTPFDLPDHGRPFAADTEHAAYDPEYVRRALQVHNRVARILEEFSSTFAGKVSPVQMFWHTFDLAVQRFSDRAIAMPATVDPVTREAYSREIISAGFWFGDDTVPEPTFYSYTAPEPDGLTDRTLRPAGAVWTPSRSAHAAYYRYDDARRLPDPAAAVLGFFQSAYAAGADLAGWRAPALTCWSGVTDPVLKPTLPQPKWA